MLNPQRGQALVGVMVVMVILFALAGAVAIGASTLLASRSSASATTNDFRLRSAVNDSVAQVAGLTRACSATPPPSPLPTPTPSPIPSTLPLALPPPDGAGQALCVRMDGVASDGVTRLPTPVPNASGCRTLDLGMKGPLRVAVLFDVAPGGAGWAYLDGSAPCGTQPPVGLNGTPCLSRFFAFTNPAWTQSALSCDLPDGETAMLHVKGSATSPRQVFVAQQSSGATTSGSVYLLAVQSPVSSGQMEETVLFVSDDGRTSRQLYEAPLQP